MSIAIEVKGLQKGYGGKLAVQDLQFQVRTGTCFGLLGPNGAGKSTTMKILSCITKVDHGRVNILGYDTATQSQEVRKIIGYVPQNITLYEKLSAYDNLLFFGEMYGVTGKALKHRIREVLEQVGLADRANDAVSTFSGGMMRRINIAAALLHKPKFMILDEPTVGIDPQSRNHIFDLIQSLKAEGMTIIYSTHYMEEVEALCEDVAIIDHGQVVAAGALNELLAQYGGRSVYLELEGDVQPDLTPLSAKVTKQGRGFRIETDAVLDTIRRAAELCQRRGYRTSQLEVVRPSLEAVFLELTGTSLRDA
ncbi:ABC transporter ATP-binding protein [Paenibacillus guangzhouensis]|uniref:ABC transporter ATP-binding protein n=1 Tax=Paenibacillus guangzhouensis TaxID=1473112 RepID=UPI0012671B89|nr:ABC transporter ATP-binding protein [Paenibacillus guangzhouensis]